MCEKQTLLLQDAHLDRQLRSHNRGGSVQAASELGKAVLTRLMHLQSNTAARLVDLGTAVAVSSKSLARSIAATSSTAASQAHRKVMCFLPLGAA